MTSATTSYFGESSVGGNGDSEHSVDFRCLATKAKSDAFNTDTPPSDVLGTPGTRNLTLFVLAPDFTFVHL